MKHEDYNLDKGRPSRRGALSWASTVPEAPYPSTWLRAGRVLSGCAASRDLSRLETSRTKISAALQSSRPPKPPVTRHLSLVTAFLTGTPKQLETAVNQTKQSSEAISNRDKNTTIQRAIEACHRRAGILPAFFRAAAVADIRRQNAAPTMGCETIPNRNTKLLETRVTQTKQRIEVRSNRNKITPPTAGDYRAFVARASCPRLCPQPPRAAIAGWK